MRRGLGERAEGRGGGLKMKKPCEKGRGFKCLVGKAISVSHGSWEDDELPAVFSPAEELFVTLVVSLSKKNSLKQG